MLLMNEKEINRKLFSTQHIISIKSRTVEKIKNNMAYKRQKQFGFFKTQHIGNYYEHSYLWGRNKFIGYLNN